MVEALALVFAAQLLGEALAGALHLWIPGPVLGMLLLFAAWPRLAPLHARIESVAVGLHGNFGLLFVPVCAGIAEHGVLLARWWGAIALALVSSTIATLVVVAWLFERSGFGLPRTEHEHA
jgi:holin-like protein